MTGMMITTTTTVMVGMGMKIMVITTKHENNFDLVGCLLGSLVYARKRPYFSMQ